MKPRRIILSGEGGQGIKLITHILGNILAKLGNEVSIAYDYDAAVRGGKIVGILTYSKEKIDNPVVEEPDVLLRLSKLGDIFKAKKTVCEEGACEEIEERIPVPFNKIAVEKFGTQVVANMVALGKLLRLIGVDISKVELEKLLPPKFIEKNIEAIKYGYTYRDNVEKTAKIVYEEDSI